MKDASIDGLVIRVRDYGENDRYLTVLTGDLGRITLLAKGSRSLKGKQSAVSQLYAYSNFEYYRKGDFNILKGGALQNSFYALSGDLDRLNLAAYLCEVAQELTDEGEEAHDMLRLLLNSLYCISCDKYPRDLIKGAFELRAAAMSGYAPDADACAHCAKAFADSFYFNVMNGVLYCPDCMKKFGRQVPKYAPDAYDDLREAEVLCTLTPAVHEALRYVLHAPLSRLFSFELCEQNDLKAFSALGQTYLLSHLGHGFESLNFYHAMKEMNPLISESK